MRSRKKIDEDQKIVKITTKKDQRSLDEIKVVLETKIDEDVRNHATTNAARRVETTEDATETGNARNLRRKLKKDVAGRFHRQPDLFVEAEHHQMGLDIETIRLLRIFCQRREMRAQYSACNCRSV